MTPATKSIFTLAILLPLLLSISACYIVSFDDVSTDPKYSHHVKKYYRSTIETNIYGITVGQNYAPVIDHYVVKNFGISGPEVLCESKLPVGTEFRVIKVMRCRDCFLDFGERVRLVVKILSSDAYNAAEVEVPLELVEGNSPAFVEVRASNKSQERTE